MEEEVKRLIEGNEDYARLGLEYPLEFVLECIDNPRRGEIRAVGRFLRANMDDPTLFIHQVLYHERVELDELRKKGYTDKQLGDNHAGDSNKSEACIVAKKKELGLLQQIGDNLLGVKLPFLSLVFASCVAGRDHGYPIPPYNRLSISIHERTLQGMTEYQDLFTIEDVKSGIRLYQRGGHACTEESLGLQYATRFISGDRPRGVTPEMLA